MAAFTRIFVLSLGGRETARLQRAARAAKRGAGARGVLGFPPAQRLHLGRETGGTDPMTRRGQIHHRLVQGLPAKVLLTPGTGDQEIALAPVLVARLQRAGVLAQTSALLSGLAGSYHPQGIHLPQVSALRQP